MPSPILQPSQVVLLIIDMQEKIWASIKHSSEVLHTLCQLIKGFQILQLPIFQSEQYPEGLGQTVAPLQKLLGEAYLPWKKTTFSCVDNPAFSKNFMSLPYCQWIVTGIEAHICVLQTVKGLLEAGKQVIVPYDGVTSRSQSDAATAIAEMREFGARISCSETILFELLRDSQHPQFKSISTLIKDSVIDVQC